MSQNDFSIANQGFPAFRADLNSALQALASVSSGATEPATKYANQLWYDTATNTLKKRNEANSAWIEMGTFDEGAGTFTPTGQYTPTTQTQETWNTGTSTTESVISPAKLEAKFDHEIDDRIENKLNVSGSAPMYACRAWVNFDGTGTVAIRASGNVSSIVDSGVGLYTVNFATAMPDINYAVVGSARRSGNGDTNIDFSLGNGGFAWNTGGFTCATRGSNTITLEDSYLVSVAVFR